jgi:hypothetical protein
MRDVLQNTARKFKIYMADSTNPLLAKTGLASFTVYLTKEGGSENTVSPTITERGHGIYEVTPTTAHRDTLGENSWVFTHAGAVDFPRLETVVAVDNQIVAYDALRPTTSLRTLDITANGNAGIDWANIDNPTTTVGLTGTTVSLTTAAVALIWDALTSGMSTVGSIGKRIIDYLTGDSFARLGAPAGASIAADIATRASAAQISALQVNTRTNLQVPIEIETPDVGTQVWKIRLHLYDIEGNMEAPDGTPTVTLTNAAGTDRSSRLSAASNPSTGVYTWDYTSTAADAEEQLAWLFTVVEGALTRTYPATSYVVEETAYRFSSTDRATLNATATATGLTAATAAIQGSQATNAQTGATNALTTYGVPTNAQMEARTLVAANYATASALTIVDLWTKRNAVLLSGLLTGSGTNTEQYTISALGITATCVTDSSGNRTSVTWS